jgi:hypothetical protein
VSDRLVQRTVATTSYSHIKLFGKNENGAMSESRQQVPSSTYPYGGISEQQD